MNENQTIYAACIPSVGPQCNRMPPQFFCLNGPVWCAFVVCCYLAKLSIERNWRIPGIFYVLLSILFCLFASFFSFTLSLSPFSTSSSPSFSSSRKNDSSEFFLSVSWSYSFSFIRCLLKETDGKSPVIVLMLISRHLETRLSQTVLTESKMYSTVIRWSKKKKKRVNTSTLRSKSYLHFFSASVEINHADKKLTISTKRPKSCLAPEMSTTTGTKLFVIFSLSLIRNYYFSIPLAPYKFNFFNSSPSSYPVQSF